VIEEIIDENPRKKSVILTINNDVKAEFGYVDEEAEIILKIKNKKKKKKKKKKNKINNNNNNNK
ncbi:MAG: hypothetical protein KC550_06095, partial [Nanoarchaeota archaeon]|nr:hypothetical protein [Nanoarchaeota archaeon]